MLLPASYESWIFFYFTLCNQLKGQIFSLADLRDLFQIKDGGGGVQKSSEND